MTFVFSKSTATKSIWRSLIWILIGFIAWQSLQAGLRLRRWIWDTTTSVRFVGDARRQCFWALESSGPEGYLNQYEKMDVQDRAWDVWLDYAPLRLLVMEKWGEYLRHRYPQINRARPYSAWRPSYAFSATVLQFNDAMDMLAAVSAFLLTRFWVRRSYPFDLTRSHFLGVWQGLIAALLVWFNLAVLISAHGWPTWDAWIVPMYLLAAFLASADWWFYAGVVIAIGAMMKGQQFAVAPVFVIWPLVMGKPGAAIRWAIGLCLGIALIASPWILTYIPPQPLAAARQIQEGFSPENYPDTLFQLHRVIDVPAVIWIAGLLITISSALWIIRRRPDPIWRIGSAIAIFIAALWPCLFPERHSLFIEIAIAGAFVGGITVCFPRLPRRFTLAGSLGVSLLMCMALFNGSHSWWDCGILFGADRWHWLSSGLTDNIPGLLRERYGWSQDPDDIALTLSAIPRHWPRFITHNGWWPAQSIFISSKIFFDSIYAVFLILSSICIGLQARRNDRRMLIALVTPWLMFFLFPAEIHGRYLLYAAGISAICIGQSIGMALLGIFLTIATSVMTLHVMFANGDPQQLGNVLAQQFPTWLNPNSIDSLYSFIRGTQPDQAWAIIMIGAIFLYLSMTPSPGAMRPSARKQTRGEVG